ncbi:MAG: hypothetical protein A2X46_05320 [Lentisphaerae bacterium GWF2_57_35]|nr:MAG: hypothetical protein A2X46_05320 [Lentisphaerae bacterium GWF2_57_35]
MKIIVAFDSFKGTLSAVEACRIVADAVTAVDPSSSVVVKPMADGGEGTARALMDALSGSWLERLVTGPLPERKVQAGLVWFAGTKTALVEMASASGLTLLKPEELNPLVATTHGTGELIRAAMDHGAQKILLALGGSATVDGGVGAAGALGWRFLDQRGRSIPLGGAGLSQILHILPPERMNKWPPVEALTDVHNPLLGEQGAARIFGPQKGATPDRVETLEAGLQHLAEVVQSELGKDLAGCPGAGAAGGFGFGAVAFMNAVLVSGIETVMCASGLEESLKQADWVLTGEGSFDRQSLQGKVVSGVMRRAKAHGARVAVLAGRVLLTDDEIKAHSIEAAIPCMQSGMVLDYALAHSRELLHDAASQFARRYLLK